ncbi:MAG: hypothetical protein CMJ28_07300 [Phycisphaerae bacterium]|nr:hypothetical protein [Phycisphaerae bacterium]
MSDLNAWPSLPKKSLQKDGPLWRRTQLRLQNMATYTAQLTPTSLGFDPEFQAMEDSIASLGRLLVVKLQAMEQRHQEENLPGSTVE